jgi:NADPH:quinone reductase-like Zn-dependent oxidoreductase
MMRAAVIDRFGGPDVLHLAERPRPEPKPGEVLVRTRFAGVNYIDALTRAGAGVAVEGFPAVLGWDVAGSVAAIGAGVTRFRAGWRVLVHGASGGVGHVAVQLAREAGAEVIGTASPAHHDFVASLGASRVIDYAEGDIEEGTRSRAYRARYCGIARCWRSGAPRESKGGAQPPAGRPGPERS